MSLAPRLLPLVAVAAGGVLAVKALDNAQLLPDILAPRAAAEEAPAHKGPHAAPKAAATVSKAPAPAAAPPPAICVRTPAELAREAGLSPAELATLQNLGARRGQLDAREQALDTQMQLINAASVKLDAKLKNLGDLKTQLQALLGQADQQGASEVDRLVVVYEKMKPRDAGALMAALDDKVRVPVAAKIAETKPAVLAAIMSQMGTAEGKKLTELLAHRFTPAQTLAQALNAPAPPAAADPAQATAAPTAPSKTRVRRPARAPRPPAKPVQTAAAAAAPSDGPPAKAAPPAASAAPAKPA